MSAVSISSRRMPWQTKAQRVSVQAALAIKKEMVMQRLVRLREEEGHPEKPGKPLPVEEAASRAGVKYRTWQRWEAGDSVPYARNLSAIADAFGFEVGEFYDDSGDRAPTPSPFAGGDALSDRLQAIEQSLAQLRSERAQEAVERAREAEAIRGFLERQDAVLERIEAAVAREQQAKRDAEEARGQAEEATRRLLEAVAVATPALLGETPQPAAEHGPSAK